MSNCAWFKCGRRFEPIRRTERFCSKKCQGDEKNWRMMRGAPLVRELMIWREAQDWSAETRAAWEYEHGHKIPGTDSMARLVDSYIGVLAAEQRDYKP